VLDNDEAASLGALLGALEESGKLPDTLYSLWQAVGLGFI